MDRTGCMDRAAMVTDAPSVLVVADDLTGATDSSVQFAHSGWKTQLLLGDYEDSARNPGCVSARITDARALDDATAWEKTRDAVLSGGVSRLYLKIDSTLRGTVTAQIAGALEAWQRRHPNAFALVCPAYPAMGRTVEDGQLLVNGSPVQHTAIGTDPVTPVTTSSVTEFIPGSIAIPTPKNGSLTRDSLLTAIEAARASSSVITIDAVETSDLDIIAEVAARFGEDVVSVGSAGLAAALANEWGSGLEIEAKQERPVHRVIVVASSLHTVTRKQIEALIAARLGEVALWAPTLDQVVDDSARAAWVAEIRASETTSPIIIVNAPEERMSPSDSSERQITAQVAEVLAEAAEPLLDTTVPTALMLLGGEGARAVLRRLGTERVAIHSTVREGIPIGTIEGGSANGTPVITKAGGFGQRSDVTDIATELLHNKNEGPAQ